MASSTQPQFIANRYEILKTVGRGGMGVVYRCYDHVTRSEIALKQMLVTMNANEDADQINTAVAKTQSNDMPLQENDTISVASPDTWRRDSPFVGMRQTGDEGSGALRLALSHEFETLARLRHPNIISVLDYGFDALKMPFFTMPLLESPRTITEASQTAPLEEKISWLIEMLQALAYLHHQKIVHRDLKPDNALLTAEGTVKVLDFGLAVLRERAENQENDDAMISGTIPYMAPELLQSAPPSTRSDLFAFGLIAYEILAGHYPFEFHGVSDLIMLLLTEEADTSLLDVSEPLQLWLEGLLKIDPDERAHNALDVLQDLTRITHTSTPIETKTIQESYLQTATFVGRDEELGMLINGLREMLGGQGSSWLLIGENGVGKSRLLNELRIMALVNGVNVLQGYGAQNNSAPYQILREPVKRLLLSTPVDASEANVLKTLLPDLETILGRKIPPVVQDEISKYGSQLSSVILKLFQQQREPTLLLLDDLHWAQESIEVVKNLLATVGQSRLMIVATRRPDSTLDDDLNEMQAIRLHRLRDEEVEKLARSILGDVALRPDVQEVLKREAHGNVNFLLEVIRALLDEVQQLRDIAMMRLPQEIMAGGINRVLAQRLTKLNEVDRQLFDLMAVAGLDLDERLLNHLATLIGVLDETWLATLANNAIIEREGQGWQITHERLRMVALEQIDTSNRVQLHQQVAEALEMLYPQDVEKSGTLAYHWREASQPDRERPYLIEAGDYALRLNSFQDAVRLYRRALELHDDDMRNNAQLVIKLGESLMYVGDYSDAHEHVERGLQQLDDQQPERAHALALLADITWRSGHFDAGQNHAQQALDLAQTIGDDELVIRMLSRLGILAYERGEYDLASDFYERGLALARQHQDNVGLTMLNNNYGMLAYVQGDFASAETRFVASLEISEQHDWTYRMASTLNNLGSVAGIQGDLEGANRYFERSLLMARAIGDRRSMTEALDNLGFVAQLREEYRKALQYFEESLILAETIGNRAAVPVLLRKLGLVFEKMGDLETAQEYLLNAIRQAREIQAIPTCLSALADLARLEPEPEQAIQWAQFVRSHEASRQEAQEIANGVIAHWASQLDSTLLENYQASADELRLETLLLT
ncbi:MAG: serine/threonine-protein kinase PknK [Anaerolineae bacterium]